MGLPAIVGVNLASKAKDEILGAFGINTKKADTKTYMRRQGAEIRNVKLAQQGDPIALAMLGAIGGVKPLPFAVTDTKYTWRGATLPAGWSSDVAGWGRPGYTRIIDRAAQWYNSLRGLKWDSTGTPAPGASPPSAPETSEASDDSAPPAKRRPTRPDSKPLCKYGMRDAVSGRCPPRPTASSGNTARQFAGTSKRPCAYGPRGADGYCPKKPRSTRASTRARNKAITEGGRLAERGVKEAVRALGGPAAAAAFVAQAGLLVAAGLAAYYITKKLRTLRYRTWDEVRYQAAQEYRAARQKLATDAGRGLTPQENAQLSQWFKARLANADRYEAEGKKPSGVMNLIFDQDA